MGKSYSRFFVLLNKANKQGASLNRTDVVKDFTKGEKDSITLLTDAEYNLLCSKLENMVPKPVNTKLDKQRKAVIAQFRIIGKTAADAIAWTEKYGVNGNKRKFNDYNAQELYLLFRNAEKLKNDHIKSVSKRLKNGL